jgi:hypothetical protein
MPAATYPEEGYCRIYLVGVLLYHNRQYPLLSISLSSNQLNYLFLEKNRKKEKKKKHTLYRHQAHQNTMPKAVKGTVSQLVHQLPETTDYINSPFPHCLFQK